MDIAQLSRLIENLIRIGTVAEVDHAVARCRVRSGNLLTGWVPWLTPRAGAIRVWSPPTVGEQVMLLCPSGEPAAGVALIGIFSDTFGSPSDDPNLERIEFPNGERIDYDRSTSKLTFSGFAAIEINGKVVQYGGNLTSNGIVLHTHVHGGVMPGGGNTSGPQP